MKNLPHYLILPLAVLLLSLPLLSNYLHHKPLLMGAETYHYLTAFHSLPVYLFTFLPFLLGLATILLVKSIAKKIHISPHLNFLILLLLILSPAFIFSYSTLSAPAIFLFLLLSGFHLLLQPKKIWQYSSILFFLAASGLDLVSTLLLLLLLGYYLYHKPSFLPKLLLALLLCSALLQAIFLHQPWVQGPFYPQQIMPDLISDFGGNSGLNLLTVILALFGLVLSRPSRMQYTFIILLLFLFLYSTQTILYLGLIIIIFAAKAVQQLWQRSWFFLFLRNFILLLIFLSIGFSTASYLQRIHLHGPLGGDRDVLPWLQHHSDEEEVIFSLPQSASYIEYYGHRQPFFSLDSHNSSRENDTYTILSSTYADSTFPLLEKNKITLLYITPELKEKYPPQSGLLFLLKNERFKLLYSQENYEIWRFTPSK